MQGKRNTTLGIALAQNNCPVGIAFEVDPCKIDRVGKGEHTTAYFEYQSPLVKRHALFTARERKTEFAKFENVHTAKGAIGVMVRC